MKLVMIFLVLTLVVLMAEPGDCLFKRLRGKFRDFRDAWKAGKYKRDMAKMERRYGPNWRQGGGGGGGGGRGGGGGGGGRGGGGANQPPPAYDSFADYGGAPPLA